MESHFPHLDLVVFLIFNFHIMIEHVGERDWKDLLGEVFILLEKNSKLIYFKKKILNHRWNDTHEMRA